MVIPPKPNIKPTKLTARDLNVAKPLFKPGINVQRLHQWWQIEEMGLLPQYVKEAKHIEPTSYLEYVKLVVGGRL